MILSAEIGLNTILEFLPYKKIKDSGERKACFNTLNYLPPAQET
jgi:hypothetical protein